MLDAAKRNLTNNLNLAKDVIEFQEKKKRKQTQLKPSSLETSEDKRQNLVNTGEEEHAEGMMIDEP